MNELTFTPTELRGLIDELAARLDERGIAAEIHIVGGSAMALRFPEDPKIRVTRDVDAVFEPVAAVREVIAEMALDLDLPRDWMNANAKPFLPGRSSENTARAPVSITIASLDELIAMKLAGSREQDLHDLGILARHAQIDDPNRLVDIAFELYGEESVVLTEDRDEYLLIATQVLARNRRR